MKTKPCEQCGVAFEYRRNTAKTCSNNCRASKNLKRSTSYLNIKICLYCQQKFVSSRSDAKFCDSNCRVAYCKAKSRPIKEAVCKVCDAAFTYTKQAKTYCSDACKIWWNRNQSKRLKRACLSCGSDITTRRYNSLYCKPDCQKQAGSQRRRARKRNAKIGEPASKLELLTRSNGLCMLCNTDIDDSLLWPNPLSFSCDHIMPLSLGGDHAEYNMQASHLVCNLRKHDRVVV